MKKLKIYIINILQWILLTLFAHSRDLKQEEKLKEQIEKDCQKAKRYFKALEYFLQGECLIGMFIAILSNYFNVGTLFGCSLLFLEKILGFVLGQYVYPDSLCRSRRNRWLYALF